MDVPFSRPRLLVLAAISALAIFLYLLHLSSSSSSSSSASASASAFTLADQAGFFSSSSAAPPTAHVPRNYFSPAAAAASSEAEGFGVLPANSTLGFGAIIAVSRKGSPRREALLYAANLTGLDITIPEQPIWTDEQVEAFKSPENSKISRGSALAWMGHLNALDWFLRTNLTTAIIIEDDVDWDIRLRTSQVPLAAAALRKLIHNLSVGNESSPAASAFSRARSAGGDEDNDDDPMNSYWGPIPPSNTPWELLHLGHCGDTFDAAQLPSTPHVIYPDSTLPARDALHPDTARLLTTLALPARHRLVHGSHWPLCTFGYGVTRASAARLRHTFPTEAEVHWDPRTGARAVRGCQAYDVRILEACRDRAWRCLSLSPELLHHVESRSEISAANEGDGAAAAAAAESVMQQQQQQMDGAEHQLGAGEFGRLLRQQKARTPNVACGARSAGWFTRDEGALGWLRGRVLGQRKGDDNNGMAAAAADGPECLVDRMEEDASRWPW